jgi:hypothetical protein
MMLENSIKIIELLSLGKNPYTKLKLEEGNFLLSNEISNALKLAVYGLRELKRTEGKFYKLPQNNGKPWLLIEEDQLIEEFKSGLEIREIAKIHHRTVGAINSKLEQMNLISKPWSSGLGV